MKIIYGITKSNFGGAQRYVYELAREAKHRGHDTAVLLGGQGPLKEKLDSRGVRTISLPSMWRDISLVNDLKEFVSMVRVLRREKPDVFHVNSSKMGGLGAFAGRVARVPMIVFTAHGWAQSENRPAWQKWIIGFLHWLTILLAHKTICVSEKTMENVSHWPLVRQKLFVVHNGIASFELKPRSEARARLGIKSDTLAVGTIAELHWVKGLDVLLRAWYEFKKNHEGILVIIGEGEERHNLGALTRALHLEDSVYFAGYIDNARAYLSALDIFVFASRSENLPYAPLEAGLAALPVIATEVGGVPEIIKDLETGALVQPEYPEEICHVLDNFARDPALRTELGDNLKKFVESEYSLHQMFDNTFTLYKRG